MAATAEGTLLTARHRRVQAGITARTLRLVAATWPLLDLRRLDDTAPGWAAQALGLLRGGHALSARAAMSYFAAYRLAEGATGSPPDVVAPALDLEAARTSLLVTGPVAIKQATGRGTGIEQAGRDALSRVLASSQRHVQAGGRGVIVEAVRRDRQALGWARVASADACAFCGMLASRGAVYKSEDSGEFEAHDGCGCDVEAAYSAAAKEGGFL